MGIFDFLKKDKKEDDSFGDLGGDFGPEPAFPGDSGFGMPGSQRASGVPGVPQGSAPLFGEQPQPPQMQQVPPAPMSMQMSQPSQPSAHMQGGHIELVSSRIEVISSKIDSLRASIDRLNEKMDYLERLISAGGRRYG